MTEVYLGNPPKHIMNWILSHKNKNNTKKVEFDITGIWNSEFGEMPCEINYQLTDPITGEPIEFDDEWKIPTGKVMISMTKNGRSYDPQFGTPVDVVFDRWSDGSTSLTRAEDIQEDTNMIALFTLPTMQYDLALNFSCTENDQTFELKVPMIKHTSDDPAAPIKEIYVSHSADNIGIAVDYSGTAYLYLIYGGNSIDRVNSWFTGSASDVDIRAITEPLTFDSFKQHGIEFEPGAEDTIAFGACLNAHITRVDTTDPTGVQPWIRM